MSIVSNMTITIDANDDSSWAPTTATGIYSTGTLTLINNSTWQTGRNIRLETADAEFIALESLDTETTITKTLAEIFPGQELVGNYIKVGGSSIHTPERLLICAPYTACGAPTSFSCSPTLTDSTTTLSWSGATAGTNNAIARYEIQYRESSDGSTWGNWTALTTVTSTATSGSKSVSASATYGNYRQFRIRTRGAAGSSYYSSWKVSSNAVRRNHEPFGAWTDATLTRNVTPVKMIHMEEMRERVTTLLAFYGASAVSFGSSEDLKDWTTHITELRNAIDRITTDHDTWITISENKPTVDVITQLREIIMSL